MPFFYTEQILQQFIFLLCREHSLDPEQTLELFQKLVEKNVIAETRAAAGNIRANVLSNHISPSTLLVHDEIAVERPEEDDTWIKASDAWIEKYTDASKTDAPELASTFGTPVASADLLTIARAIASRAGAEAGALQASTDAWKQQRIAQVTYWQQQRIAQDARQRAQDYEQLCRKREEQEQQTLERIRAIARMRAQTARDRRAAAAQLAQADDSGDKETPNDNGRETLKRRQQRCQTTKAPDDEVEEKEEVAAPVPAWGMIEDLLHRGEKEEALARAKGGVPTYDMIEDLLTEGVKEEAFTRAWASAAATSIAVAAANVTSRELADAWELARVAGQALAQELAQAVDSVGKGTPNDNKETPSGDPENFDGHDYNFPDPCPEPKD